jgi:S-DNA-T family DNA segregation ATPase FtsK/SpoIIIE
MQIRLSVRDGDGYCRDIAVSGPVGTSLGDVADAMAGVLPRSTVAEPEFWNGSRKLPSTAMFGGPGLRTGDIVDVDQAGERDLAAGAVLRLHVVGGPDAGLVAPLPKGVVTIGRAPACDLTLTDPDVSRQHAAVTVTSAGITLRDLGSTNGTLHDGSPVEPDGSTIRPGELLRMGESLLCIAGADEPAAAVRPGPDGTRLVNRPPRFSTGFPAREVVLPVRSAPGGPQRIQWLAVLIPAVAAAALALAMHNIAFLAFALLSPVVMIGTAAGDRLHWRRARRREAIGFRRREAHARGELRQLLAAEIAYRRRKHPDAAAVSRTATIPDCRLWERRRGDPVLLDVRIGVVDQPAALLVRRASVVESAGSLPLVPAHLNMRAGPLGIAGPRGLTLGTARWVVAQLAVMHSPADLDLILLLSDEAAPAWTWTRWLPHLRARVACTAEERSSIVARMLQLIDDRLAARQLDPQGWSGSWTVLVVDRSGALADIPGLARVLAAGPTVGITAVCLDEEQRRLPTACAAVARVCGETGSRLAVDSDAGVRLREVVSDRVGARWAERVARALAPLVDSGADATAAIPDSCRLLELLDLADPTPDVLLQRWHMGHPPMALIGLGVDGVLSVDLVRDGPHALIAGTTGAGKSELLQSLVASLAASNSPDDVSFVLIDYKGGAAFADCARLPHTVGLVTDLDPHLTQRALRSLNAELRRREALFARAAVKDLDAYRDAPRHDAEPIGRLVLVVDEFAALAEELPDFISGLIGIAQRGRSLGVHLILATQRPGGVISPEIRANIALRVALRVTDLSESIDVIASEAAAAIDKRRPGRAFLRAGSTLTEVQTARVGAPAPISSGNAVVVGLDEWGRAPRRDTSTNGGKTDLQLLVDAAREAMARSGGRSPRRPWLPPLVDRLAVKTIGAPPAAPTVPVGLIDVPDEQRQAPLCIDLAKGGALMLAGGPRSGRSTALLTLALTGASRLQPDDLHIYAIDCGGALRPLADLPHCGGLVTCEHFAAAGRLLGRLSDEATRRQSLLAEFGVSSIAEARAAAIAIPLVALLVDGWERFTAAADEHDGGQSVDLLLSLIRESAAVGLTVALAGDRSALAARLAGSVARKFVLNLADRADYAMAGIPARAIPASMPPGRAVQASSAAEVQFAFAGAAPGTAEQRQVALDIASSARSAGSVNRPFVVCALPNRVRRSDLASVRAPLTLLGVGGDAAETVGVDMFDETVRLTLAGPPRSGRTTALRLILEQAPIMQRELWVAAPRRSPLFESASAAGALLITPEDDVSTLPRSTGTPVLLLVDDSEMFLDTGAGDALTDLVKADDGRMAAIVAGRTDELAVTYRGIAGEVRRSRCGLLLQPGPGDGDLLGVRLPRGRAMPTPGRGVLVLDQPHLRGLAPGSAVLPIQVALP